MKITDHELSVLLGNLLENAIEACMEQKNTARRIIVKGKGDENSLIVTIDNTCENEIKNKIKTPHPTRQSEIAFGVRTSSQDNFEFRIPNFEF